MWPFSSVDRLFRRGFLGINRRNAQCMLDHNPRSLIPIVDDKLRMAELCRRIGVPTPPIVAVVEMHRELRHVEELLRFRDELVIKPARGSGGRGVMVLARRDGDEFVKASGRFVGVNDIRRHAADILSGVFSLSGQPDRVIFQERIGRHSAFEGISPRGIPDIRLVLYRFEPAMAMLRLPTLESGGRANLHQGGIGVGVDLVDGITHRAVWRNRVVECHPDTGESLIGRQIPAWEVVVTMARRVSRAVGLGFVGIDIVLDEDRGPMLLEANARPGLAIQQVNNQGLLERIDAIEASLNSSC